MLDSSNKDQVISHCESLIKQIKDVVSAKIVTDSDGKISEIHVLSKSNRNPKQIVRDIESALIAFLGSEVDHKKISIAQIGDASSKYNQTRLKIEGISINKTYSTLQVTVTLADSEDRNFKGVANGVPSLQSRVRAAATAALKAVQLYLEDSVILSLEDIHIFNIGSHEAISVLISVLSEDKCECLLGGALIKQDICETAVEAVLNALNRRLSVFVSE